MTAAFPLPIIEVSKQTGCMSYGPPKTQDLYHQLYLLCDYRCNLYILFKRLIPMLMPFIMALAIAAALDPAVSFLGSRIKGGQKCAAAAVLLLFYGCLFSLAAVSGNWLFSCIQEQGRKLPALYSEVVEPGLSRFFTLLEASFPGHSIHISSLGTSLEHAMENAAGALSSSLIGYGASVLVGFPSFWWISCCGDCVFLPYRKLPADRCIPHAPDSGKTAGHTHGCMCQHTGCDRASG